MKLNRQQMQIPFDVDCLKYIPPPPRARIDDRELKEQAAKHIASKLAILVIQSWDGRGLYESWKEDEENLAIERDIYGALLHTHSADWDGLSLMEWLERKRYWEKDLEIANILDDAIHLAYSYQDISHEIWVKDNYLYPQHTIGEDVIVLVRDKDNFFKKIEVKGKIISIYYNTYKYAVNIPELGHKVTTGLIVSAEEIDFKKSV